MPIQELAFQDSVIRVDEGQVCLTDLWQAAGAKPHLDPSIWFTKEQNSIREYIGRKPLDLPMDYICEVSKRDNDERWAHWLFGQAYCFQLSQELHVWGHNVLRVHMEVGPAHVLAMAQDLLTTCQEILVDVLEIQRQNQLLHAEILQARLVPTSARNTLGPYINEQQREVLIQEARKVIDGPIKPFWRRLRIERNFDGGNVFETIPPEHFQDVLEIIRAYQPKPKPPPEPSMSVRLACAQLQQDLQLDIDEGTLFILLDMHPVLPEPALKGSSQRSLTQSQYQIISTFIQNNRPHVDNVLKKYQLRGQPPAKKVENA